MFHYICSESKKDRVLPELCLFRMEKQHKHFGQGQKEATSYERIFHSDEVAHSTEKAKFMPLNEKGIIPSRLRPPLDTHARARRWNIPRPRHI